MRKTYNLSALPADRRAKAWQWIKDNNKPLAALLQDPQFIELKQKLNAQVIVPIAELNKAENETK